MAVAVYCNEHPLEGDGYFPRHSLKMLLLAPSNPDDVTATMKRDRSKHEAISGLFEERTVELDAQTFATLRKTIDDAGCWAGQHCQAVKSALPPNVEVCDGEDWLVEAARGPEHWALELDNPEPGPFVDVAKAIVHAAGADDWLTENE